MELNMGELLDVYPRTTDAIIEWFTKMMFTSLNDVEVSEEMKEFLSQNSITSENLSRILDLNPRVLLDFFDENEIYIEISVSIKVHTTFGYLINRNKYGGFIYKTRKEAEKIAVHKAFELLNTKLEENEKYNETSI